MRDGEGIDQNSENGTYLFMVTSQGFVFDRGTESTQILNGITDPFTGLLKF